MYPYVRTLRQRPDHPRSGPNDHLYWSRTLREDANRVKRLVRILEAAGIRVWQDTADILPGRVFHGRVASLSPATGSEFSVLPAENATGNFTKIVQRVPVRILLDDADADAKLGLLRPGLSVTTEVDVRPEGKN